MMTPIASTAKRDHQALRPSTLSPAVWSAQKKLRSGTITNEEFEQICKSDITFAAQSKKACDMSGFITKKGRINVHSWKRRYFVLDGSRFWYYGSASRDILMGGGVCQGVSQWPNKNHGLILICQSGRNYQLVCDSDEDCQKWWHAFTQASVPVHEASVPVRTRTMSRQKTSDTSKNKALGGPASSTFFEEVNLVDEVVGKSGLIEDDTENISSFINAASSLKSNMFQKCKSLFVDRAVGELDELGRRGRSQSEQRKPKPHETKLEDFRLVQTVGKGGFGKVLKVRHLHGANNEIYAMKILRKAHVLETNQITTTKTERRILQQTHHPFIAKLRYAFQSSSKLYMIMDYYSGGSLFYHTERNGIFAEDHVAFFAAEITLALDHLHQHGVIYRDLKLENVLLDGLGHVALTDFGLSKDMCNGESVTRTFCGTPLYVAPELISKQPYGFSIDWWALGIVIFELISGRVPFASRDRRKMFDKILNSEVVFRTKNSHRVFSDDAEALIGQLLIKDPHFRIGCCVYGDGGKDVQDHTFFAKHGYTDFERIYRKEIIPPFTPPVYICESNVIGIAARDTAEILKDDLCHFDDFTMLGSPR